MKHKQIICKRSDVSRSFFAEEREERVRQNKNYSSLFVIALLRQNNFKFYVGYLNESKQIIGSFKSEF